MQTLQLIAHLEPQLRVEVRQRFVHEQNRGLRRERSCDGDTLLLAAGELGRIPVHEHADLDDAADAADGEVDLLLRELSRLLDDAAVPAEAELPVQRAARVLRGLMGCVDLCLQCGDRGGAVGPVFQMIAEELLRRVLRERKGVDELEDGLLFFQLAVLVAALVQNRGHIGRGLEDLSQTRGIFGLEVDLRELLFDVGEAEGDVLVDRHVGPERIVLEQEADLALVGRDVDAEVAVEDDLVADRDAARRRGLQTRDHAERRGLAAAGRTEQRDERVIFNGKIQVFHSVELGPALGDVFEFDFRHVLNLLFPCQGLLR